MLPGIRWKRIYTIFHNYWEMDNPAAIVLKLGRGKFSKSGNYLYALQGNYTKGLCVFFNKR